MGAFKGFGFESSDDILAQKQAAFQQAMSSGNQHAMRAAAVQQAASTLFGDPALRKAQATEQVIKDAFKSSQASATGDEVQDHISFLTETQRLAIENDMPEIAMQATEQLSTLRVAQEERSRLKSKEEREATVHDIKVGALELETAKKAQQVLVDENGEPVMNIDITDQADLDKMAQELKENPNYRLVGQEKLFDYNADQLLLQQKLKADKELAMVDDSDIPVTTLNRFYDDAAGQMTFAHSIDTMVDILGDNPDAFTASASLQSGIAKMGAQGRAAARAVGLEASYDSRITGKLDKAGITDGRKRAAIMDLAYGLATSREGGRLTDADIDRAIETLGFLDNPDPRAIIAVLQDRLTNQQESWDSRGEVAGLKNHKVAGNTWREVKNIYSETQTKLDTLRETLLGQEDPDEEEDPEREAAQQGGALSAGERGVLFN